MFVEGHGGELWESPRSANHQILLCLFPFLLSLLQILSHVESLKGSAGDVPVRPEVRAPAGLKSKMIKKRFQIEENCERNPEEEINSCENYEESFTQEDDLKSRIKLEAFAARASNSRNSIARVCTFVDGESGALVWEKRPRHKSSKEETPTIQDFKFSSTFGFQVISSS